MRARKAPRAGDAEKIVEEGGRGEGRTGAHKCSRPMNYCHEMVVSSLRHGEEGGGGEGGYRVLDTLFTKHLTTAMARYIQRTRVPSSFFFFLTRVKCVSPYRCSALSRDGGCARKRDTRGRVRFCTLPPPFFLHLFAPFNAQRHLYFRAETRHCCRLWGGDGRWQIRRGGFSTDRLP